VITLWSGILIGSALVFSWKILGYLVPQSVLNHPVVSRVASLLTVALLAALLGVQGLTDGGEVTFDARIPALAVSAVLLYFRAPFIVMVAAAAATAAIIRMFLGF
jgi:hypothetical protein